MAPSASCHGTSASRSPEIDRCREITLEPASRFLLSHPEAGTTYEATRHYAVAAAPWWNSCGPDWRAFDAGDWQEAARRWHHLTGLPLHPGVQDLLYERHGLALAVTRELDDLAEAVQHAGHFWTGQDLIDLATVTLAPLRHSARPGLRTAAFLYLHDLAIQPSPLSGQGFTPLEDSATRRPSWGTPATGLLQHAGVDSFRLMGRHTELESVLTSLRYPADGILDLPNARALELAAAASHVIRARCERAPKAEGRLKALGRRRLEELEHATRVAATTRTVDHLSANTEMTICRVQMRTALIKEHYSRLKRQWHQPASTADTGTASCDRWTREHPTVAPDSQGVEADKEGPA